MIEDIASELCHPYSTEIFINFDKALEIAEIVLNRIEKEGMLPPEYNMNEGSGKYKIPSCYTNEWEPEDEK